jgi:site-specific recombinase XerD
METADKNPIGTIRDRAFMFRNGLAISILAARAFMRRKNLASIVIGKNLIRDQSGFVLQFGKDEMKQKREASMFLPNMLTPMIDRYIDYYRPGILNGKADPGGALWVSHFHEMIEPKGLANEIVKLTSAAFGKRISPHKFRHCAATSIANLDSKNILMVPTILFHSNFKISEKFYIFADSQAAFFAHDKALSRLASVSSAP